MASWHMSGAEAIPFGSFLYLNFSQFIHDFSHLLEEVLNLGDRVRLVPNKNLLKFSKICQYPYITFLLWLNKRCGRPLRVVGFFNDSSSTESRIFSLGEFFNRFGNWTGLWMSLRFPWFLSEVVQYQLSQVLLKTVLETSLDFLSSLSESMTLPFASK